LTEGKRRRRRREIKWNGKKSQNIKRHFEDQVRANEDGKKGRGERD
jgi:hypothetical protein